PPPPSVPSPTLFRPEPGVQPLLPEEPEQVHPPDAADGTPRRQEVRRQEVADAAARPALAAGVVPVELAVEPEVAARKEIAVEVRSEEHTSELQSRVD